MTNHLLEIGREAPSQAVVLPDILQGMRPELERMNAFMSGEQLGPYASQLKESEQIPTEIVWDSGMMRACRRFVVTASDYLLSTTPNDPKAEVEQLIDEHFADVPRDGGLTFVESAILSSMELVTSLRGYHNEIISPIAEATRSARERFAFTRLLAEEVPYERTDKIDKAGSIILSVQALYVFGEFDTIGESSELRLEKELESKAFDGLIAEELLLDTANQETKQLKNGARELEKMTRLAGLLSGNSPMQVIAELTRGESIELWPESCKELLERRRSLYHEALKSNRAKQIEFLQDNASILPTGSSEELVIQLAGSFRQKILKQRSTNMDISSRERMLAAARIDSHRPRRKASKRSRDLGAAATAAASAENGETLEPKECVYIDSNGNELSEGSPEYKEFIGNYLGQHRGEPGLEEDLQSMLDYIKTTDWSKGLASGIKKLKSFPRGLVRGERRFSKVYELKPFDATGLPTSSIIAEKVRIVFVREDNKVGLVGIADKSDFPALERNLGVTPSGRKRR